MNSLYERNTAVPRVRISHYPARSAQPHLRAATAVAARPELELSYTELIITASIAVAPQGVERESEAS